MFNMYLIQRKQCFLWALAIFFGTSVYYYTFGGVKFNVVKLEHNVTHNTTNTTFKIFRRKENQDFLINTPGCYIPNYAKTFMYSKSAVGTSAKSACGVRAIFIDPIGNTTVKFRINQKKMRLSNSKAKFSCCYRFASPSTIPGHESELLNYTKCKIFKHGYKMALIHEIVTITCIEHSNKLKKNDNIVIGKKFYEDAYIILKKIKEGDIKFKTNDTTTPAPWNILLLGIDTMSRTRVLDTMPLTTRYLQRYKWLDYKGYQKVEYNTFPNLLSVLTGKKKSTIYSKCKSGHLNCADYFIWDKFKNAGYKTAHGEDYLRLPDTFSKFKGFKKQPTDHFMRPFYLTGERRYGQVVCTQKKPSATHLLEYAHRFVNSYKNNAFFGMFWINSYSHNLLDNPTILDEEIVDFFEKLNKTGALSNTFVFFFSDHGIRFGKMKLPIESYYDERLPMFFLWTPYEFRRKYTNKYYNLHLNQDRLTTPYDLYLTLADILKLSINSSDVPQSEACPQCTSMFEKISPNRTCEDAGVIENWCSCHNMSKVKSNDTGSAESVKLAVAHIKTKLKSVKTIHCMMCKPLNTSKILRSHVYHENNKTYYVIAFAMPPGLDFETVAVNSGKTSKVISVHTISPYNTRGNCVLNPDDRPYCVCILDNKCKYTAVPKCNVSKDANEKCANLKKKTKP